MNPSSLKELLTKHVVAAQEEGKKYFAIRVQMGGFPKPEIIINESENFLPKLDYWCKTYNDQLVHNFSPTIEVDVWASGNSFAELEEALVK